MFELSQGIVLRRCSGRESVPAQKAWTWSGLQGTDLGFALAIWPTAAGRGRGLGRGMTETRLRENEDSWRTSLSTPQVSEEHGWMVTMIGPERELASQALIENAALTSKGIRARLSWAIHCGGSWSATMAKCEVPVTGFGYYLVHSLLLGWWELPVSWEYITRLLPVSQKKAKCDTELANACLLKGLKITHKNLATDLQLLNSSNSQRCFYSFVLTESSV